MILLPGKFWTAIMATLCCCVFLPDSLEAACTKQIAHDDKLRQGFLERLGKGGLVIVLRHTSKEKVGEPVPIEPGDSCSKKEEPLYAKGKKQALEIQSALQELNVTFSQILHSQWCRAEQTATLVAGPSHPKPMENTNLNLGSGNDWLKCLIRSSISEDNVLLVTHSTNLNNLGQAGLHVDESSDHGIAAVFDPAASDHESFLGCISPDDWAVLVKQRKGAT